MCDADTIEYNLNNYVTDVKETITPIKMSALYSLNSQETIEAPTRIAISEILLNEETNYDLLDYVKRSGEPLPLLMVTSFETTD